MLSLEFVDIALVFDITYLRESSLPWKNSRVIALTSLSPLAPALATSPLPSQLDSAPIIDCLSSFARQFLVMCKAEEYQRIPYIATQHNMGKANFERPSSSKRYP